MAESRFFNRELSWLEFNQRVLDEARDQTIPLLERLKFLAITASNLDEFFMVRVGGLQILSSSGSQSRDPAGMTPEEQLSAISTRTHQFVRDQYDCYLTDLEPALDASGIRRFSPADVPVTHARLLEHVFNDEIVSVLAPMAVSSRADFPLLLNRTISMCVRLERKPLMQSEDVGERETRCAIIPFGRVPMRFITLPSPAERVYSFVLLEELVEHFVKRFFPEETVLECAAFRITRNADMALREDLAFDLLTEMEELLVARTESDCVRLEVSDRASEELVGFLQSALDLGDRDVYRVAGPLDLSAFMPVAQQLAETAPTLRYDPWPPRPSPLVDPQDSIFDTISRRNILLLHPYESFDPVIRLIEEAAVDPDVIAIKQTLYRTSRKSPIVAALTRAAEKGKHVTVIVELKARFDEERNIEWARALEQAGVQVFFGVKGLKTHAKICIVVRREPHGIQRYIHFGTGNYNEATARLYSDVSLLTCDEELGADAVAFFNSVTGYSLPGPLSRLAAAPLTLRERLVEMIDAEIQYKRQRQRAFITVKVNSLVDPELIEALYRASQAGVRVRLNIRGICCLRPGVPGLSENIEVVSVVDRFLEHARVMHFRHGGDNRVFISSADWMPRNLDRRVELLVPVDDDPSRQRLIESLECYFHDRTKGRQLQPDGSSTLLPRRTTTLKVPAQEWLYRETCERVDAAQRSRQTMFEPHRAPGNE